MAKASKPEGAKAAAVAVPKIEGLPKKKSSQVHAVFFVHGFQGQSTDLCLIKGHLSLVYPSLELFSSKANEEGTGDSLEVQGNRLAAEVAETLLPFVTKSRRPLVAISFVGHSMGNLIVRSALQCPELQPYLYLLHLFVSISGPHLGFLYSTNAVLDTGISVMKSMSGKGKQSLYQLSLSDAPSIEECYLFKLAMASGLSLFKHVVLVSSVQDRYVPNHSARLADCVTSDRDKKRGPAFKSMLSSLLSGLGDPGRTQLLRIDVDFDFTSSSFSFSNIVNKKIGRQAHIAFIGTC